MKKVSTTVLESLEVDTTEERPSSLSVSAEQCHSGDSKVPFASIQGIWRKAEELLVDSNSIAPAPGFDEEAGAKMVRSRSGKSPHLVKCWKGGRVSCDSDCPNWKSIGIRSHCVFLLISTGSQAFTDHYAVSVNRCFFWYWEERKSCVPQTKKGRYYQSCSDVLTHISFH